MLAIVLETWVEPHSHQDNQTCHGISRWIGSCSTLLQLHIHTTAKTSLEEIGHPQPKTPAMIDNSTAAGLIIKTMTPKRAKAYDQRNNWLKCRQARKQFDLIWKSGKLNRADFHTQCHPIHIYKEKEGILWQQRLETSKLLAMVCLIIYYR